jgi:apolipoprotein N-acyltransferase
MRRTAGRVAALSGSRRYALAATLGAVTALAQPPVSWPVMLFLALPPLAWLLDGSRSWRGALLIGWVAGAAHFAAALFWIVDPFLVEPEVFGWMAPFALVGMAGGLALFWAPPFALARAFWPPGVRRLLALAALWALADLARAYVLTGFPWGLPAYAWVETPVMQTVAVLGPHGLGLLTLVAALMPAAGSRRAAVVTLVLVAAGWGYGAWRLSQPLPAREPPVTVRLVQPDAEQAQKWQPGMAQAFYERHLDLTAAAPRPDIVVWSETAVPFLLESSPDLLAESAAAAAPGRLILGIQRSEPAPGGGERYFNSLAVLNGDGTSPAVYDKHRLVPFGEYIPLKGFVARLGIPALTTLTGGGFTPGPGPRVISVPGVPPFLPLICYEAIFPQGLRVPGERPEWLLQVTNDAWFGEASGPYQHLAQARVRAIEQGLPLARAANTGISAMVDPYGRVIASLGIGEMGVVDTTLPSGLAPTVYVLTGDLGALIAIVSVLVLTFINLQHGKPVRASR